MDGINVLEPRVSQVRADKTLALSQRIGAVFLCRFQYVMGLHSGKVDTGDP